MTTMPKATRFRIRLPVPAAPAARPSAALRRPPDAVDLLEPQDDGFGPDMFPTATKAARRAEPATGEVTPAQDMAIDAEIDAIRREGLTGRQLRLARRMAEKHQIAATSDFDAVRQLRKAGMDPFGRSSVLDIVSAGSAPGDDAQGHSRALATTPQDPQLPQLASPTRLPSPELRAEHSHASDIERIQRDIGRRRRRRMLLLWVRLSVFVGLPTLIAAFYYAVLATPLYATRSEFVIQQAESPAASGLGGLFSGTQFATSQDSIAVQGYLQSRDAMLRLDQAVGFRRYFADPSVDPLQRLEDATSIEAAYKIYRKNVQISYDQTEGIIKLEVSAPSPDLSAAWSRELIRYAEEQVNHLSERLRGDQMKGARESYDDAEAKLMASQQRVVELQERNKVLSSEVEITLLSSQITALETQLTQERLALAQMLSNASPNRARVEPVQRRIGTLEQEIANLRARLTEDGESGRSLAKVQSELLVAQGDVQTRQLLLTQAAQQLEIARIEANRQQRYLSLAVAPVAPDVASYPRAFENTTVALLIFAGIYLMVALTASILREQVSN
ncbi:capsular polysaccharide transport system permease protein [Gemmobacter megaterium]|uniref:Capsular polysaccharide transport system permease protein n=1 Tax=Gemmobacter megaterium TaxID=1086013 RepID=A0A1N7KME5_9RHOB|nr:capsule biosynthesis protein [Gemmobacter megaterium]GGE02885.1 capsule polysaccharide transporter [Gemmobacter megaterium]SIS62763.1 capsular polysaccharide transport system permease protein [Gemmobacter megaterium]